MRNPIEKEIAKRQAEVDELTKRLAVAEEVLATLKDIFKRLPQETSAIIPGDPDQPQPRQELRHGSDLARARAAILAVGRPLHITELLNALQKANTKENRVSLTGSLGSYVRKGQIFNRPAPNVFGVVGMEVTPTQNSLPIASLTQ